ncbi:MAG: helix-hairpin-helix domain-containing protein, partial [Anaerolineae bacterium]
LPGIGPSTAQRIIEGRPYAAVEDLLRVKGIGQATFDKIKGLVTVK